ncbi:hypothetical protein L1987_70393 [Smallanthus sonchifolius]|uniref:Uncharacterized protein n=1 Tax=Smallanthus sonchifolius TaxID=185202 RepID=A0ACB9APJ3_9ASTR|nr:hypothetical protein L1987_70393 [Smallanthus sonchifolius]
MESAFELIPESPIELELEVWNRRLNWIVGVVWLCAKKEDRNSGIDCLLLLVRSLQSSVLATLVQELYSLYRANNGDIKENQ